MGQLAEWQTRIWKNKVSKGFNTTDVEREFNYTYAELAEAYDSYRKDKGDLGDELADVMIFILSLAEMNRIDLETAVTRKMDENERRQYIKKNGHHVQKENI